MRIRLLFYFLLASILFGGFIISLCVFDVRFHIFGVAPVLEGTAQETVGLSRGFIEKSSRDRVTL